jgi:hypothetical protein
MTSAVRLVGVLLFWVLIGITWAVLNEQVIAQIPIMFPEPIAQDGDNWGIMLFIWNVSIIGLALGSGMSILGRGGLRGPITSGALIFCGQFTLIFLWASFWNVTNVVIPGSFSTALGTASNVKANLGIYDASFEFMMLGLALMSLMLGGQVTLGGHGKHRSRIRPTKQINKTKIIRQNTIAWRTKPRYGRRKLIYEGYEKAPNKRFVTDEVKISDGEEYYPVADTGDSYDR